MELGDVRYLASRAPGLPREDEGSLCGAWPAVAPASSIISFAGVAGEKRWRAPWPHVSGRQWPGAGSMR